MSSATDLATHCVNDDQRASAIKRSAENKRGSFSDDAISMIEGHVLAQIPVLRSAASIAANSWQPDEERRRDGEFKERISCCTSGTDHAAPRLGIVFYRGSRFYCCRGPLNLHGSCLRKTATFTERTTVKLETYDPESMVGDHGQDYASPFHSRTR